MAVQPGQEMGAAAAKVAFRNRVCKAIEKATQDRRPRSTLAWGSHGDGVVMN
jgi:hypothetical protein